MVGTGLLAAACSHSYRPNVGKNSEGVAQALGDPVNGDLDGKAIHCSRLVKGPFRPTNSWSISFWASLSFCALGLCEDGKEVSRGLKKSASLVVATRTRCNLDCTCSP